MLSSRPRQTLIAFAVLVGAIAAFVVLSGGGGSGDSDGGARTGVTYSVPVTNDPYELTDTIPLDEVRPPSPDVRLKSPGKLVVCTDVPYAPFEFYANGFDGRIDGVDADLVSFAAAELGLTVEYLPTSFETIFSALTDGACDVVASAVEVTASRSRRVVFTGSYLVTRPALLVRVGDAATLVSPSSLAGKSVGVVKASAAAEAVSALAGSAGFRVRPFDGVDDLLAALTDSRVDAAVDDLAPAAFFARRSEDALVVSAILPDTASTGYAFAVARDNPALGKELDRSIANARSKGRLTRIVQHYLGNAARYAG